MKVSDFMGRYGVAMDLDKLKYYLLTTPEQRKLYSDVIRNNSELQRGPLDEYQFVEGDILPVEQKTFWPISEFQYKPGGEHKLSIRYHGGLHWGWDDVGGRRISRIHKDFFDPLGFGVIPHNLIEVAAAKYAFYRFALRSLDPFVQLYFYGRHQLGN